MRFTDIISYVKPISLVESPQIIDPTDFDLDDPVHNAKETKRIFGKKNAEVLWDDDAYKMVMTGRGSEGYFALLNKALSRTVYSVRYETQRYNFIGHYVTQVAIWRDINDSATKNLSEKMFFDHILPMRGIVVSDRHQTEQGMVFWRLRMRDAIDRGLRVGLIDIHRASVDWSDTGEAAYRVWLSRNEQYWNRTTRGADFRFVIAKPDEIATRREIAKPK